MFLKRILNSKNQLQNTLKYIKNSNTEVFNNFSSFSFISIPMKNLTNQNPFLTKKNILFKNFSEKFEKNTNSEILKQQQQTSNQNPKTPTHKPFTVKKGPSFAMNPIPFRDQSNNNVNNPNTKFFQNLYNSHQAEETYHELQENHFDLFLEKIQKLMEREEKRRERNKIFATELHQISLNSKEPLREILVHYQCQRNENGFDAEAVAETILVLGKTNSSRTRFHKCYSDFSHWEFINSVRLYHLVDDIKFSVINSLAYLNGEQFCKIIKGLKLCSYKNTELALLIEQRLASIVFEKLEVFDKEFERYSDTPVVGKKDFLHLNAYATDIAKDKNILGYFEKLMKMSFGENFEKDENDEIKNLNNSASNDSKIDKNITDNLSGIHSVKSVEGEKTQELTELEASMQSVIDLMHEAKDIQMNFTDNISNLIDQYLKFEQVMLENPEIRENPYTKYQLQKIQDKLIEMGFIDIDTYKSVSAKKLSSEEFAKLKRETVIKILRDYIYVNYPDLFAAVIDEIELTQEKAKDVLKLNFTKYRFSAANFAECIKELSEYAKLSNIDINGQDYETSEFNLDYYNKDIPEKPVEHIKTRPEYTKLYQITKDFFKSIKKELFRKFKNVKDFNYHVNLILAYANLNTISKETMELSIRICLEALANDKLKIQNADLAKLLYAAAICGYENYYNLMHLVFKRFDFADLTELDFDWTVKMLWSLLNFESKMDDKFFELLKHLNTFDIYNYITEGFEAYDDTSALFYELSIALREYAKRYKIDDRREVNDFIYLSHKFFENKSILLKKEELDLIDPLKENAKNIFIEKFYKNKFNFNAQNMLKQKQNSLGFEQLAAPFNPDFVLDIYGNKIYVFLNSLDEDFKYGFIGGRHRLIRNVLEKFYGCVCVFLPLSKLITFNPNTLDVKFNKASVFESFDKLLFGSLTHKRPKLSDSFKSLQKLNSQFNKFIANLVNANNPHFELIQSLEPNMENLEIFFKNLLFATELEAKFIYNCSFAQFNLNLLEFRKVLQALEIISESLSDNFQKLLVLNLKFEEGNYANFKEFLIAISTEYGKYFDLLQEQHKLSHSTTAKTLLNDDNWVGKRLNVDLINSDLMSNNSIENLRKKNIAVEILNNNYMWFDHYNPYSDWEEELKANFDNFNYFATKSQNKFYFNSHKLGSRKVPEGIFPHPRHFRVMKQNCLNNAKSVESQFNINSPNAYESEINRFYHLNEILIAEEIKKNNFLKKETFPTQLSMKINLLNINNTLKQNFTDNEIIRYISEFEFTEKLIEEHLKIINTYDNANVNSSDNNNNIEFVSRNAESFKAFHTKLDNVREQLDEYDKYIMKEYYKEKDLISYDERATPEQIKAELEGKMKKKLDENEDQDALSIYNPNEIKYEFNLESILNNIAADSQNSLLSFSGLGATSHNEILNNAEKYLEYKRLVSERNLILLKIVTKIIQSKNLTENEKKYLANLYKKISASNILNLEKKTLCACASKLQIKDLTTNDLYALNALANVEIKENLFNFAISDLVLELNNFIDNKTFNKIIHEIFAEAKAKEFKYDSTKNSLFDVNNKEPLLLNKEIKETIWRVSGFFDALDAQKLKAFLKVKRGKSTFDKVWLQIDEASLEAFIRDVNKHENRIEYLENWIKRKENEFENRIQLPPDNLRIEDSQINKIINKKDKNYRKKLLANIFQNENLKTISHRDVNKFVNEFVEFLPLFNFKYPETIKDIFIALQDLEEFNNIYKEDLQMLKTYKTLFKIEEENPNEFLAVAPIKMEQEKLVDFASEEALFDKDKIIERVKASTIPFVKNVTSVLLSQVAK
jgi:hypothetical protein